MNPHVCFEVDVLLDMRNWESVIVYGRFEELTGKDADMAREVLFGRIFPLMTSSTVHPHQHEVTTVIDDTPRVKFVMYRIKIESLTGRFEK
jgi:nitroimidazol reductase NimA-like FMN-containing flavoprotein (pyridoxamine 5'-phosphate oxidase superfamily)